MNTNRILEYFFRGDSWFAGDWNPSAIDYERLRGGWFKDRYTKDDIVSLTGQLAIIYTVPKNADVDKLVITTEDGSITCSQLRQLCVKAMSNLGGLSDLRLISDAVKEIPPEMETERMASGILFLGLSSLMSPEGMVTVAEEAGTATGMTYRFDPDNLRTVFSWGEVLAFSFTFNHLFYHFIPPNTKDWLGSPDSSYTKARKDVEAIIKNEGVRQAWLEDIQERRTFTSPALSEVTLGGFWGSLFITEDRGRLCLYLMTENGCVPGIINLDDGSSNICLSNPFQFYSTKEMNLIDEHDTSEEMEATRRAIDLIAIGAWRDITTRATADAFYDREKEEKLERVKREKSNKTKAIKRVLVRYLPRRQYESDETGSSGTTVSPHYVTGFLRRLPEGHKASQRQVDISKEYKIRIPDGYTFVSPHIRGGMIDGESSVKVVCYSALSLLRKS